MGNLAHRPPASALPASDKRNKDNIVPAPVRTATRPKFCQPLMPFSMS